MKEKNSAIISNLQNSRKVLMTNIELLLDYDTRIVADLPALELPRSRCARLRSQNTRISRFS